MKHVLTALSLTTVFSPTGNVCAGEAVFVSGTKSKMLTETGAGEGPAWNSRKGLLMSGDGNINLYGLDGKLSVFRKGAGTNGLLFDRQGRLLACEPRFRRVTRTDLDGTVTLLTDNYQGKRYNQPNDVTVDSQGRIYFSDPKYGSRTEMQLLDERGCKVEGVYRIDPDGLVTRMITHEVDRPNGVLVSFEDRFLYVADNNNDKVGGARKLWRFDLRKDGTVDIKKKTLIYDWGSGRGPDGMVQDQQGRLYVAGGLNKPNLPYETADQNKGGIYVFSTAGKLIEFVPIPRDEVTNCTFGGDDLRTLYITAGGTLWSIRATTPGRLP